MEKLIIIKYGELSTKKDNIGYFLSVLKKNIVASLKDIEAKVEYDKGRMFIYCAEELFNEVISKLQKVFGIHEIVIGYKLDREFDNLKSSLVSLLENKEFETFKVVTKRSDKKYPMDSMEISRRLGGEVLKNYPVKVDVRNPELTINVEIRKDSAYIYFESVDGCGGYPTGVQGKGILMLSGGIDSPVAGYLACKRGIKLECLYFESPPHTSLDAKNKVLKLASKLAPYNIKKYTT